MPYEMKNRFLILGLTGPVGSGCTSTGKFLSGENIDGITIKDILERQTAEREELIKRIKRKYGAIKDIKDIISKRESRSQSLGPYKDLIKPTTEDLRIKRLEKLASSDQQKLKRLLRKREIINALDNFRNDRVFNYQTINDFDIDLFGFRPFIYISFTTIILKIAIESFKNNKNNNYINNYFTCKVDNSKDEVQKKAYNNIREICLKAFEVETNMWKNFKDTNLFIHNKKYSINLEDYPNQFDKLISQIKILCKNKIIIFYKYYEYIQNVYITLKKGNNQSIEKEYSFALSEVLQDWGDNIRATGNPFLFPTDRKLIDKEYLYKIANEINVLIKLLRYRIRYIDKDFSITMKDKKKDKTPALFVIECIRNQFEIDFFRSRYSEFYLISIYANEKLRRNRVPNFSKFRDERDQGSQKEGNIFKLDVRTCVLLSDIALINDKQSSEGSKTDLFRFFEKFLRYFVLIRSPGCIPPTDNELYMHLAYSQSLKSNCLSRKVGSVIIGPKGYIYGAGWNDVGEGQIGCGLRTKKDIMEIDDIPLVPKNFNKNRFRNIVKEQHGDYICYKDVMSRYHTKKKINGFREKENCEDKCIDAINEDLNIKRLEFCRALHAEENALLQISKVGGLSVRGGAIYTTTFPCELCAKKIYQTGIRTVYYTEPYPESISEEVFFEDGSRNIELIPFEGVKSYSFYRLYKPVFDKKDLNFVLL